MMNGLSDKKIANTNFTKRTLTETDGEKEQLLYVIVSNNTAEALGNIFAHF